MLVAGLYDGNVAVYNLQVPTTDLVFGLVKISLATVIVLCL